MNNDDNERRMRPIYDTLDLRDYRRALKLINNQIAKNGGAQAVTTTSAAAFVALSPSQQQQAYMFQILRAVKAFALDRIGKHEEALQVTKLKELD